MSCIYGDPTVNAVSYALPPVSIYSPETVINNMQSSAAWTKGSQGVMADNTTDYIRGGQCVTLTSNSALEAHIDIKGLTLDFTGKQIIIYVKFSNVEIISTAGGYARICFGTDDDFNFANAYALNLTALKLNASQLSAANNVWHRLSFSLSEATVVAGAPNWALIKSIRWQMDDNNNGVAMYCQGICTQSPPAAGMVTITFDDGYASLYSEARKKMDAYSFKGVAYAIPSAIGVAGYCTLNELKLLQEKGWDIGSHYATNLTALGGASVVENVFRNIRQYFAANGLKAAEHFAYPNGAWDETIVLPLTKKYFRTARTVAANFTETYPPANPYKMRVFSVLNTTTTASIATAVDNARTYKEWLFLVFHDINAAAANLTDYTIANFGTVIDDIYTDGIIVKTISEVLG